ncbi:MAG: glycosyl transferase [Candidatus Dadabacteria bacterium]
MDKRPFISVIVPVYNGDEYLSRCLNALAASSYKSFEIIVVDDASTDDSAEISRKMGATVLKLPHQSGPAAARNYGTSKAQGDILFFVDSDVVVQPGTIARVVADFQENPDIAAIFGSYDDNPASTDFLSQLRNLFHYFIHQNSNKQAKTFWAGCGAIYKEVFCELKGFDEIRYPRASIEDIELGLRIWRRGYRIMLDKELQVKHLKRWAWGSCLKTDIFYRAVPWSRLILESGFLPRDLNQQISHRISALLVGLLVIELPFAFWDAVDFLGIMDRIFFTIFLILIFALLIINRELYAFLFRRRGIKFMLFAIPVHFLYYSYSSLSFAACWFINKFSLLRSGLKRLMPRP